MLLAKEEFADWPTFYKDVKVLYSEWMTWIPVAVVLCGQVLLLFLSVDSSRQRLKPRTHIAVTGIVAAMLFAVLTFAAAFSLGSGVFGDRVVDVFDNEVKVLSAWGAIWLLWGILFYLYLRNSTPLVTRITSWLLKGSVLELLIAVPCHVIARRRHDCCAPGVTAFGMAAGIAIMLLSFGPSVLLLYKKRLDAYPARGSATQ